ncbi:uncharacterized protein LOC107474392 [Arachis duranensis]|uniref:Uncharacterized protein LOC107474392 n=1 Tax=Arachis duranensis TaxID=130453 RepID=A0A6P4CDH1_ARADU|nr:uncharacterized protein LOC107474392 [Arachis duranensis]
MADELSNVNGGSSTNDSIPPPLTVGWPPYGLPAGYTPSVGGFVSPIGFGNANGVNVMQNPQQHSEYSREYHVGSTSSYHDLVNLLTQQMTTILNPMMADHESRFEHLDRQVERIARIVDYDEGERHNARGTNEGMENIFQNGNHVLNQENCIFQNENHVLNQENPFIVRRHENADNVLHGLRGDRYQITRIIEEVLNRVGLNVGFMNQPHFISAFSQVVQMAEVPRGVKNPKITTKFAGEVGESTTEHVAHYLVEIGNLANDENLKMKFFPSSLTKNAFTWFSNLRPNSITTWNQLETAFHAQFYRGEMNIAVMIW